MSWWERALTQQLQLVTNWNVFPLENAYSSKSKSFTENGWFWKKKLLYDGGNLPAYLPGSTPPQPPGTQPLPSSAAPSLLQWGLPWTSRFSISLQLARTSNGEPGLRSGISTAAGSGILSTGDSAPPMTQDARSQTPLEKSLRQPPNRTKIKSVWIYLSHAT